MEHGDRRQLSSSFGAAAVAYAEHRPDYAEAAARWALEGAPGPRVLDLGAGTGQLTAGLLALGAEVTAVGPIRRCGRSSAGRAPSPFDSPEQAEFPYGRRRTADSLVATLATRAGVLVMPEEERAELLARIRANLASRRETADGEFTLPMVTCVLRVRSAAVSAG
jgi:SAM-dependent methyltransferase